MVLPYLNFLLLLYIVLILFVVGTNNLKTIENKNQAVQKPGIDLWCRHPGKSEPTTRVIEPTKLKFLSNYFRYKEGGNVLVCKKYQNIILWA
jgi:hypothetical protein